MAKADNIFDMLEDFAKLSGESLDDIIVEGLAEEIKPEAPEGYEDYPLDDLRSEDTIEDEFTIDNEWGDDTEDYLDEQFDGIDVDMDELDHYDETETP